MAEQLPDDWQERMVEMIRGARPLDPAWFTGGPVCSPLDQIGIYHEQYRHRLYDALLLEIPGLGQLLGDEAEGLLRRYLFDHPSTSWTLNRVADPLAEWLQAQGVDPSWIEMAHLDRAVQKGFEAAEGTPIDPASLVSMPPLVLQPHVSLLRLSWNVHEVRSAILSSGEPPELRAGDFPIVVFRRGLKMRHWVAPLALWGILDAIGRGATVSGAVGEVFARGWVDTETLAAQIGGWFKDLAERQLVSVRVPGRPIDR